MSYSIELFVIENFMEGLGHNCLPEDCIFLTKFAKQNKHTEEHYVFNVLDFDVCNSYCISSTLAKRFILARDGSL